MNAKVHKEVIDGKAYNPATSKMICSRILPDEWQILYRNRVGAYFFLLTNTVKNVLTDEATTLDRIQPVTWAEATHWINQHGSEAAKADVAGDLKHVTQSATLTLRLDASIKDQLQIAANVKGVSMNEWCVSTLTAALQGASHGNQ